MNPSAPKLFRGIALALGLAASLAAGAGPAAQPDTPAAAARPGPPTTPDIPVFPLAAYAAMGSSLAQSGHFAELGWNEAQLNAFLDGFRATFRGNGYPMDDASRQLTEEMGRRMAEIVARARPLGVVTPEQKGKLEMRFKELRRRFGLQVSESGLGYNVEPGRNGIRPRPGDTVIITCDARAADGTTRLPQLSTERIRAKMDGMMPGLIEGLQMMTVGSHAIFVVPPALSFGQGQWPDGVERAAPLVYSITLHDVVSAGTQP